MREVRRAGHLLGCVAEELHEGRGVTAAEREVLERLTEGGPQTVPAMARARGCSRQHIQARVDALRARGLVQPVRNPAHRRSSLIALTPSGTDLFRDISRDEEKFLEELVMNLLAGDLAVSARTLAALNAALDAELDDRSTRLAPARQ